MINRAPFIFMLSILSYNTSISALPRRTISDAPTRTASSEKKEAAYARAIFSTTFEEEAPESPWPSILFFLIEQFHAVLY